MSRKYLLLLHTMMLISVGASQMLELVEMVLSEPQEPVHRVHHDPSSAGVQKIKIFVESREDPRGRTTKTVLPLSIESASGSMNNERPSGKDTMNKRQTIGTKTANVQKVQSKRPSTESSRKSPQSSEVSSKQDMPVRTEQRTQTPPSKFGIGNTLVLSPENGDVLYVDQSQPHKLAEPLRYEPEVGPSRPDVNNKPNPLFNENQDKLRLRTSSEEKGYINSPKEDVYYNEQITPKRKEDSGLVYDEYYETHRSPSASYSNERGKASQDATPYQPDPYEVSYQNGRVEQPPKKVYEDVREPDKRQKQPQSSQSSFNGFYEEPSPPKKVSRPEYEESYTIERPIPPQRKPSYEYEENFATARPQRIPQYEESYVALRPTHEETERPSEHYQGFPESLQPSRNPVQSRPLQNDPPRLFPSSPCSSVFKYEGREPGEDRWSGEIFLTTDEVLVGVRLDIALDRPARLLASWFSDVKSKDNTHFTIFSLSKRLVPGSVESVRIEVRYDSNGRIPFLQSLNLNGRRICPVKIIQTVAPIPPAQPSFENEPIRVSGGNLPLYQEENRRPSPEPPRITTSRTTRQPERRPTTPKDLYSPRPEANPTFISSGSQNSNNRVPVESRPTDVPSRPVSISANQDVPCGAPAVQPRPLITHGQMTARGQWPWHAAIYKNVGIDLSYICGGSLISANHVVTAAHCVTNPYSVKTLDASILVVYLGKYHRKLWSEGGVLNKQVSEVKVHPSYNSTDFRADLAVLVLSSPIEFTEFIRPVCLWDRRRTDIADLEKKEGTVVGWGFDETKELTEELMQAKMPIINQQDCLWSYPEFFPQFTSNLTYCAGFRNGTSVCNGDSGGGMVFPVKNNGVERWYLRGLVSISASEKSQRICDTKHYVVFTDLAKFLNWLGNFVPT